MYITYTVEVNRNCRSANEPVRTLVAGWAVKRLNLEVAKAHWELVDAPPLLPVDASSDDCAASIEMIKLAFKRFLEAFVRCYNACLAGGNFPSRWKRAKLVLLHKGQGKPRWQSF